MRRESTIKKIKEAVVKVMPTAKVILFGSQARNEAREDSDIDVLILVDVESLSYLDRINITDPLFDLEIVDRVMISPLIYTFKEWYGRPFKSPFFMNVMHDGIEL